MNTIQETALTVCVVLIGTELFARLVPKNSMLNYVRGLIFVILFLSAASAVSGLDFSLPPAGALTAEGNGELAEYLSHSYEDTVKTETRAYITGLLQTIEVTPKEIRIYTERNEEESISIKKITVITAYETDSARSKALLKNVVGKETVVEVKQDGA